MCFKGARTYCIINEATPSGTVALLAKSSFNRASSPTALSSLGTATVQKN